MIKSIQLKNMDNIFMNSENSKTSEPYVLILTDKSDLRRSEKKCCFIKPQYFLPMEKHKQFL